MTVKAIDQLVNLKAYPIADRASPARQVLVEEMGRIYERDGVCLMSGFLTDAAVNMMAAEAENASADAYHCDETHNAYLELDDTSLPADHPRRQRQLTRLDVVGCDQLIPDSALWGLYGWDPLRDFIGAVLGYEDFHRFADPIGAMTINVMNEGDRHGWHYDEAMFTVSVMLQAPDAGGQFEFVRGLRDSGDDNYDRLDKVLAGTAKDTTTIPITPGALLLFGGRKLLHRVTGVEGSRTRYITTLCYRDRPGVTNSPAVRELFYGRREPLTPVAAH